MVRRYWISKEKSKWISKDNNLVARIEELDVYVLKNSKAKNTDREESLRKSQEEYLGIINSVEEKGEVTLDSTGPWNSYEKAEESLREKMKEYTPKHHY